MRPLPPRIYHRGQHEETHGDAQRGFNHLIKLLFVIDSASTNKYLFILTQFVSLSSLVNVVVVVVFY